jgi:hypothetical protein
MIGLPKILQPKIVKTIRGPIFVFHGKWRPAYRNILRKHEVVGIAADFYRNEYESDFEFLNEFNHLQYFSSGAAFPICLEPLYNLKNLRYVQLLFTHGMTLDFTRFKNLEAVDIPWAEGMNSILERPKLKRLALQGARFKSSTALRGLKSLEALDLRDASLVEIEACGDLPKLRKLKLLLLPRLTSFAPLGKCSLLRVLHVGRCGKAVEIECLQNLKRLKYLILTTGKTVNSLDFIKPLAQLKLFHFDCNVLDGNLSPLKTLPSLAHTVFRRQRHYPFRSLEIQEFLTSAGRRISNEEILDGTHFGLGIDNWVFPENQ